MDLAFWRGRRVLLTGHTGFKGTWLSLWLARLGAEVTGYSAGHPSDPCAYRITRAEELVTSVDGDIRDAERLAAVVRERRPEVVFHMAAQPLVRRSYEAPLETYGINVMGTVALFEAVRVSEGVRVVVNVTSDKAYENREWLWPYREDEPKGGHDPYSSSKACSELVTAAYRASFFPPEADGVRLASARAGNVIGGGDWAPERLLPDMMRAALEHEPLVIRSPSALRPWQHVLNPLSGYLLLAERLWLEPRLAGGWNLGPPEDDALTVGAIAERVCALWGEGLGWTEHVDASAAHEAQALKIDSSKARALLGWAPPWGLDEALARLVEWYLAYRDGADMQAVTIAQIDAYEAAAGTAALAGDTAAAPG